MDAVRWVVDRVKERRRTLLVTAASSAGLYIGVRYCVPRVGMLITRRILQERVRQQKDQAG